MAVYTITTEGEEAVAAATAETLVQLRGATTTKGKLVGWFVSFDGILSSDAPVVVRLLRQTTDGTGSGATEVQYDPDDPASQITGFHSFSAEPTAGDVLESHEIHPQGGGYSCRYELGREPMIDSATSSRLAVEVNAPAGVNALAGMIWEE